mgnify:FL=1
MKKIGLLILSLLTVSFSQANGKFPDGSEISNWFTETVPTNIQALGKQYVITKYGVKKDSTVIQTQKIQAVIDLAAQTGGVVVFPKGTFLTGALFFRPGTHLHLQKGAVLKGSDDISDFPVIPTRMEGQNLQYFAAVVNADKVDGFTISGEGTINGNGLRYWKAFWLRRQFNPRCTNLDEMRPRLVFISNSKNVQLSGVKLMNSPFWTTHLYKCENVKLLNLHIYSPAEPVKAPSTDGIDIDVCTNVLVKNCYLSVNDDAIALKGGKGPTADRDANNGSNRNIIIEDCVFGFCHGVLTCGSESIHNRNIILRNSEVKKAQRLFWLKMRPDTPQNYEYILVDNIKGQATNFIYIKPWTQFFDLKGHTEMPMSFSNYVTMRNIDFECDIFFNVSKSDQYVLSNFTFENLNIKAENGSMDQSQITAFTVKNVRVNDELVFSCALTNAQAQTAVPKPMADQKIVDNTLDSINLAMTVRPVAGSSRKGNNPVLFLVGNSTMRNGTKGDGANGQWGWGYFAQEFFDANKITVENHALGGLSSRTFYESFWDPVKEGIRPGDWVIVQLGHNDNGPYDSGRARASIPGIGKDSLRVKIKETGVERTVYSYGEYMRKFVKETQAKGANVILMSLTMRNHFDSITGGAVRNNTHAVWAKQIANEMHIPFIDMNEMVACRYDVFGPIKTQYLFYKDKIHTNEMGARLNASIAAEGIRECPALELAQYLKPAHIPCTSAKRKGNRPVLFTIGDSTVKNTDKEEDGMWGWGSVIEQYFDTAKITVDNQGRGGRSSRTYLDEGLWDKVYEALQPGDFVMMQFGHNDGGPINTDKARGTIPGSDDRTQVLKMENTGRYQLIYTYGWYLRKFIMDAKERGAIPIVLSHVPRNQWDADSSIKRNNTGYGLWAREAAEQAGAYFIDLNEISAAKFEKMNREDVNTYFKNDHTHSSLKGARLNAESIIEGLKNSDIPLREFVKNE